MSNGKGSRSKRAQRKQFVSNIITRKAKVTSSLINEIIALTERASKLDLTEHILTDL